MIRSRTTIALAAAAAGLAAGHLLRHQRWQGGLDRLAHRRDAMHLRDLRTAGMLTRHEATRVALWTRAYPPGALIYALTSALTTAHPADRAVLKREFLARVAAQIGPSLPTGGFLTLPAL